MIKYKELTLISRNKKLSKHKTYEIAAVWHTKMSDQVIAKIGSYDKNTKVLVLNVFRLIYWLSKNHYISHKLMKLFNHINLFDKFIK